MMGISASVTLWSPAIRQYSTIPSGSVGSGDPACESPPPSQIPSVDPPSQADGCADGCADCDSDCRIECGSALDWAVGLTASRSRAKLESCGMALSSPLCNSYAVVLLVGQELSQSLRCRGADSTPSPDRDEKSTIYQRRPFILT